MLPFFMCGIFAAYISSYYYYFTTKKRSCKEHFSLILKFIINIKLINREFALYYFLFVILIVRNTFITLQRDNAIHAVLGTLIPLIRAMTIMITLIIMPIDIINEIIFLVFIFSPQGNTAQSLYGVALNARNWHYCS